MIPETVSLIKIPWSGGRKRNSYYTSYLFLHEFLRQVEKMLSQTDYKNPTENYV